MLNFTQFTNAHTTNCLPFLREDWTITVLNALHISFLVFRLDFNLTLNISSILILSWRERNIGVDCWTAQSFVSLAIWCNTLASWNIIITRSSHCHVDLRLLPNTTHSMVQRLLIMWCSSHRQSQLFSKTFITETGHWTLPLASWTQFHILATDTP